MLENWIRKVGYIKKAIKNNELSRQILQECNAGVHILVVDPLNRLEQDAGMTEREFIRLLLKKLNRFASQHKCLVILVAHLRKMNRNEQTGTRIVGHRDLSPDLNKNGEVEPMEWRKLCHLYLLS